MGPPEAINENLFGALTAGGDNASARTPMNLVSIGRAPGHTTRPSRCFHGKSAPRNGFRVTDVTGETPGGSGVSPGKHRGEDGPPGSGGRRGGQQRCCRRLRIGGGGDGPAHDEEVGAGRDRLGRSPDAGLVVGRTARQADAGNDRQEW